MLGMVEAISFTPNGYVLGFDFGIKRIGVAVGQSLTKTATPLSPLAADQGVPNWQLVQQLITQWQPNQLVVGLPLNMDGHDQFITRRTRAFIKTLHAQTQLPVHSIDERLSSVEARAQLFAAGGYAALKKKSVDSFAAKLILEHWFSMH